MSGPMAISQSISNVKSRDPSRNRTTSTPPPASTGIDLEHQQIGLRQFGEGVQEAVRAVFPNETASRYVKVTVLILLWADDHPDLPALEDVERLSRVFKDVYSFVVERFEIPKQNPHFEVTQKVRSFARQGESNTHLKIVYYAGYSRVTIHSVVWTSWRSREQEETPSLLWSEIQPYLERAQNDVLILLDCNTPGGITSEGNGVTEVVSAGEFDPIANTMRPYSFTNAIATELETMSRARRKPLFSIGELYSNIYKRIQDSVPESGSKRHPSPTHHVLTQENPPRSIHISIPPRNSLQPLDDTLGITGRLSYMSSRESLRSSRVPTIPRKPVQSGRSPSREANFDNSEVPRLAFAIRLEDTFQDGGLPQGLFEEWFKFAPAKTEKLKVEAAFNSDTSLLIISVPISISTYIPKSPAVIPLGPIRSSNLLIPALSIEPPIKPVQVDTPIPTITTSPAPDHDSSLYDVSPPRTPLENRESICSSSFSSIPSDLFNPFPGFESDEFLEADHEQTPTLSTSSPRKGSSPRDEASSTDSFLPSSTYTHDDINTEESTIGLGLQFSAPNTPMPPIPKIEHKRRTRARNSLKLNHIHSLRRTKTSEFENSNTDDYYDPLELSSWLSSHLSKPPPEDADTNLDLEIETINQTYTPQAQIQKFTGDESLMQTPTLTTFTTLPNQETTFELLPERVQFPPGSTYPLPIPPSPREIFKASIKATEGERRTIQAFFDPSMIHCWTSPEFVREFGYTAKKIGGRDKRGFDWESGVLMPRGVVVVQVSVERGGREGWCSVGFNVSELVEGVCLVFGRGFEGRGGVRVRRVGRG